MLAKRTVLCLHLLVAAAAAGSSNGISELAVANLTWDRVTLQWVAPDEASPTRYSITSQHLINGIFHDINDLALSAPDVDRSQPGKTVVSLTVAELEACGTYNFIVNVVDERGATLCTSNPIQVFTFDEADDGILLQSVTAKPLPDGDTVRVHWKLPKQLAGRGERWAEDCVTGVRVFLYEEPRDPLVDAPTISWSSQSVLKNATLRGLYPCTQYSVEAAMTHYVTENLKLKNGSGRRQEAPVVFTTLEGPPDAVANVKAYGTRDSICVKWDEPQHSAGCAKEYEVQVEVQECSCDGGGGDDESNEQPTVPTTRDVDKTTTDFPYKLCPDEGATTPVSAKTSEVTSTRGPTTTAFTTTSASRRTRTSTMSTSRMTPTSTMSSPGMTPIPSTTSPGVTSSRTTPTRIRALPEDCVPTCLPCRDKPTVATPTWAAQQTSPRSMAEFCPAEPPGPPGTPPTPPVPPHLITTTTTPSTVVTSSRSVQLTSLRRRRLSGLREDLTCSSDLNPKYWTRLSATSQHEHCFLLSTADRMDGAAHWFTAKVWPRLKGMCGQPTKGTAAILPMPPATGRVVATRSTEVKLQWTVEAVAGFCACPGLISLAVNCKAKDEDDHSISKVSGASVALTGSGGPEVVTLTLCSLTPDTEYTCAAKYFSELSTSECQRDLTFRTNAAGTDAPSNILVNGSSVSWEDPINNFDSAYVVEATVEMDSSIPACCEYEPVYRLFVPKGWVCCAGLDDLLPRGRQFSLAVRAVGGQKSSEPVEYKAPEGELLALKGRLSDRDNTFCDGTALDSMMVILDAPCASTLVDQSYFMKYWYATTDGLIHPVFSRVVRLSPEDKEFCAEEGRFKIPFDQFIPEFDWCTARGQLFTLYVSNIKTTRPARSFVEPTIYDGIFDIRYQVPMLAVADENVTDGVSVVLQANNKVAVIIPRNLIVWTDKRPDFYSIIVAEAGYSEATHSMTCEPIEAPATTWRLASGRPVIPPFKVTEDDWRPLFDDDSNYPAVFVLGGDENSCDVVLSGYCNGPLIPGKQYVVTVQAGLRAPRMVVTAPRVRFTLENSSNGQEQLMTYVGVLSLLVFINLILMVRYFMRRCPPCPLRAWFREAYTRVFLGGRGLEQADATTLEPFSYIRDCDRQWPGVPQPLTIRQFRELCNDMPRVFLSPQAQREFEVICALSSQMAASTPSKTGNMADNTCKNRYRNIIPFDKNRVQLQGCPAGDDVANYINASLIIGFSGRPEYIAAQGPKENTTKDFWFMVYEQNVRLVVMLTKLMEDGKNKCHQYYPELGDRYMWGDLGVTCCVQNDLLTYTLRTIVLRKGSEERLVHHLHFLEWPDFGCPASPAHVLQFCMTVRRHALLFPGMILVHCSAGVGRTGTLIGLDILLQCTKAKKRIDVFGVVLKLREQRTFMVQSQEQYCFLYNCLKTALDDPALHKYKPSCKWTKTVEAVQTIGVPAIKHSFQWKK